MSHANAALTPRGRLRLARLIVDERWPIARAAERYEVSWPTAKRWAERYRQLGAAGMASESSRPHRSPARTPQPTVRKIVHLRCKQRLGPVQIAGRLGLAASTVHAVLTRCRLNRLSHIDRVTGEPIRRYEHDHPGAMLHIDVKKLGRSIQATIAGLEALIKQRVAEHPRAQLLAALPGVGTINLAQLLAEIDPILDRVDTIEQAAAECGVTPVTKASDKTSGVYFRWAANTRARKAITAFAHNARMQSPWAAQLYTNARARGKRSPHATRIVARAWLRVIWACWHNGTPYDPTIHQAAQRLTA
ncbi:hypothetical protein GCM10010411_92370 [Actinomadura fulvescens]|uniref:Transposase IS116/IS110/IS902 C-terminal domain-containing protein n=1 Tax=Actinomadura fulvescens TaxID=46160 RepID=A0ABN3QYE2_9ACTN